MKLSSVVLALMKEIRESGDREIGDVLDRDTAAWLTSIIDWQVKKNNADPMDSRNCDLVGGSVEPG